MPTFTRQIIVIDGRDKADDSLIPDVLAFFRSTLGGSWDIQEVAEISGTGLTRDTVVNRLHELKTAAYSIVICFGNAHHAKVDRPWAEAHLVLPNGDALSERDVNVGSPRLLQIFDGVTTQARTGNALATGISAKNGDKPARHEAYNNAIRATEEGVTKMCSYTVEGESVGFFSLLDALIRAVQSEQKPSGEVLTLDKVFEKVVTGCSQEGLVPKLEYRPGRRLHHLPIAVF